MSDRDKLADLIYTTLHPEIQQGNWLDTADGTGNVVSHLAADAILAAGWRSPARPRRPKHHRTNHDYPDLIPNAVVTHPKWGTGRVTDSPWEFGQLLVEFTSGRIAWCNPDRLSTPA